MIGLFIVLLAQSPVIGPVGVMFAQSQVIGPLGVTVAQSQLSLLLMGVAARARGFSSRF